MKLELRKISVRTTRVPCPKCGADYLSGNPCYMAEDQTGKRHLVDANEETRAIDRGHLVDAKHLHKC